MAHVLLGTLSCGEADLDRCMAAARAQTYPCEQYVIANLPEPEANYRLYRTFFESTADFMIRLDADMVLSSPDAVRTMVERIEAGAWHKVSHPVADFFTDRPIMGIHIYSRKVEFDWAAFRSGELHPDRRNSVLRASKEERARIWKIYDEPLALHCHFADDHQSFHFGFHRRMKNQLDVCRRVAEHAERNPDPRLAWACLGALAAHAWPDAAAVSYGTLFDDVVSRAAATWPLERASALLRDALTPVAS
ncbi:MAG: hypothetical protein ACOYN0_12350 [Phycisphaerales bacterium]